MRRCLHSFPAQAGAILIYCYGAVIAPTLHHVFHHPDHIHVGDSIVYLPEDGHAAERGGAVHSHDGEGEVGEHEHDTDADDEDHDHHEPSTEAANDHDPEHDEDHGHEEVGASHHDAEDGTQPHDHEHHHHNDPDHGGSSVFHFGAALSDHIDRTPVVVASVAAVPLVEVGGTQFHPVRDTRTLRVRGPPVTGPLDT